MLLWNVYASVIKIYFIPLLLLLFSNPAFAFVSTEGGFSIWMPSEPTFKEIIHKSFAGNVVEKTYTAKTDSAVFIVSYSVLPKIAIIMESDKALLTKAKEGFLKDNHSEELSFEKALFSGKPGRELKFRILTKDNIIDAVGKARFILVDKTMYVMVATEYNYDIENKIINQFLDSFKFLSG